MISRVHAAAGTAVGGAVSLLRVGRIPVVHVVVVVRRVAALLVSVGHGPVHVGIIDGATVGVIDGAPTVDGVLRRVVGVLGGVLVAQILLGNADYSKLGFSYRA